jgi:hypothetical protein
MEITRWKKRSATPGYTIGGGAHLAHCQLIMQPAHRLCKLSLFDGLFGGKSGAIL